MKQQLRDIEYFSAVAEHGHLGRAANALGLTQPALSKSLRRLEQSMQAKLVQRTSKGMTLTAVGEALFSHVHRLRLSLDDVTREITDLTHGREGHLRIASVPLFSTYLVPAACAAMLTDGPRVRFKISFLERDISLPALRNGELDLFLTPFQPSRHDDLVEEHLFDHEVVVYASARHRLGKLKNEVTLADLVHERWAVAAIDAPGPQRLRQAFVDAGLPPPDIALASNSFSLRHQVVASSDLLGFAPKRTISEGPEGSRLVVLRVSDLAHTRRVGVLYRKGAYLSPVARRFIEILKAAAKKLATGERKFGTI